MIAADRPAWSIDPGSCGGNGGDGAASPTGGAGGCGSGAAGSNGTNFGSTGGGGGGGGPGGGRGGSGNLGGGDGGAGGNHGNGNTGQATINNSGTLTGTNGSNGFGTGSGGGGGGGAGGYGALVTGSGASSNSGTITGGNGGNGGFSFSNGFDGSGGGGGHGVSVTNGSTFTNTGTITGGQGGTGGSADGANGYGIFALGGFNITIINSGTISGGGAGRTQANAISFQGSDNVLELRQGSSINGLVDVGNNGTLRLGGSGSDSFDVSGIGNARRGYTGFSTFEKTGTSTWTLTGTNTTGITWTINGGTLMANGSMDSTMSVASGGTLNGTGSVGDTTVASGGTLGVGSIGTLTVNGNLVQNAGSTFAVNVTSTGTTSLVTATGTATLGGAVLVTAAAGTYGTTTRYTILHADGGVAGAYSGVTANFAFLTPTLSYGANDVFLTLNNSGSGGGTSFARGAQTGNQRSVGAALDQAAGNASGDFLTVINALSVLNTSQGPAALDQIGGQNYSGFQTLGLQQAQSFMNTFSNLIGGGSGGGGTNTARLALMAEPADACMVVCDAGDTARWGAWGGGIGGAGTVAGDASSHGLTYNLGGFVAGLDYRLDPRFVVGATAGYTTATAFTQGMDGRGTSDTVQAALYGQYKEGAIYLDALAGYARSDNKQTRPINIPGLAPRTAYGRTFADQFFGQLEGGYRMELGGKEAAFVTPFARLQGSTWTQAGFSEWGADSLNLNVGSQTSNSLRTVLGAQMGASFDVGLRDKVNAVLRLGWSHEYADTSRPVTASFAGAPATPFTVQGAIAPRDGAVIGLATDTRIAEQTKVYFRYDGDLAGGNTAHIFSAGVRIVW